MPKRNIKDLGPNEYIHCPTEDSANIICKMMHELGMMRASGEKYIDESNWHYYGEDTTYAPHKSAYAHIDNAKNYSIQIYPRTDFIYQEHELKEGDLVLVKGDGENREKEPRIFLHKLPLGNELPFLCVVGGFEDDYKNGFDYKYVGWKQARKRKQKTQRTIEVTQEQRERIQKIISE